MFSHPVRQVSRPAFQAGLPLAVLCTATLIISVPASPAFAGGTDFEGIGDSVTLTNQVPGVVFGNGVVLEAGISLNELSFPPRSGVAVATQTNAANPLSLTFTTPVTVVSGYVTYSEQVTFTAFDSSNNVLTSFSSAFNNNTAGGTGDPGSSPNELFSYSNIVTPIARFTLQNAGGATLDDLAFTPVQVDAAPEPGAGALVLIVIGVAGLFARRQGRGFSPR